jgi:hypothetical protein
LAKISLEKLRATIIEMTKEDTFIDISPVKDFKIFFLNNDNDSFWLKGIYMTEGHIKLIY